MSEAADGHPGWKDGVVQQIGRPQEVYDSPVNLFVAKFLGTPPVNVFEGSIKDGRLYIGQDEVLEVLEPSETGRVADEVSTALEMGRAAEVSAALETDRAADKFSADLNSVGSSSGQAQESGKWQTPGSSGKIADGKVYAAIRPEGFLLQEDGPLRCELDGVEVMGRDISVVSKNKASLNPTVRSIIGTENMDRIFSLERSNAEKAGNAEKGGGAGKAGNAGKGGGTGKAGNAGKGIGAENRGDGGTGMEKRASGQSGRNGENEERSVVRFGLIPRKVLLFDRESEKRIYFRNGRNFLKNVNRGD